MFIATNSKYIFFLNYQTKLSSQRLAPDIIKRKLQAMYVQSAGQESAATCKCWPVSLLVRSIFLHALCFDWSFLELFILLTVSETIVPEVCLSI